MSITNPLEQEEPRCPLCGTRLEAIRGTCPVCGHILSGPSVTLMLEHLPNVLPVSQLGDAEFEPRSTVMLQFLPSGQCISLGMIRPTILGRGDATIGVQEFIDLSPYNAEKHGVSRRHLMLRRGDHKLLVVDLHSTNGTYLNGERMKPNVEYVLAHGDKLILGSLHVVSFFNT